MAPKKEKGTSMSLADFTKSFGGDSAGTPSSSWADDDIVLPSAPTGIPSGPMGSRGTFAVDEASLPREPPFVAFVGNLSYDADEQALRAFFAGTTSVRFPPPGAQGPRGFAYVEFASFEALRTGMQRSGEPICGRPCRIDVSTGGNASRRDGPPPGLVGGNWREGAGRVIESGGAFGSRSGSGFGPSTGGFAPRANDTDSSSASRIAALTARDRGDSGSGPRRTGGFVSRGEDVRAPVAPPRTITRPASSDLVVPVAERAPSAQREWRTGAPVDKPARSAPMAEAAPVRTDWRAGRVVEGTPAESGARPAAHEGKKAPGDKYAPPSGARPGGWRARPNAGDV